MREKILTICLGLSVFIVTACSLGGSENNVSSLSYLVTDSGSVPEYQYSETSINIVPDYELRTLSIGFVVSYPNRTEETKFIDIDTEGIVGGDYFDKFKILLNQLDREDLNYEVNEDKENNGLKKFSLTLIPVDADSAVNRFIFYEGDDVEAFKNVESFYNDVVSLFSEDVF